MARVTKETTRAARLLSEAGVNGIGIAKTLGFSSATISGIKVNGFDFDRYVEWRNAKVAAIRARRSTATQGKPGKTATVQRATAETISGQLERIYLILDRILQSLERIEMTDKRKGLFS